MFDQVVIDEGDPRFDAVGHARSVLVPKKNRETPEREIRTTMLREIAGALHLLRPCLSPQRFEIPSRLHPTVRGCTHESREVAGSLLQIEDVAISSPQDPTRMTCGREETPLRDEFHEMEPGELSISTEDLVGTQPGEEYFGS